MKYYIIFIPFLFSCLFSNAQEKILDFNSIMTDRPLNKIMTVTDIIHNGSDVTTVQKRIIKERRSTKRIVQANKLIGKTINNMQLINYQADTIYVLSTTYWPTSSISLEIKTRRGAFQIMNDYSIKPLTESYANTPEVWDSFFLLYEAIFTWNLELLTKLIKKSGQMSGSEYSMSAMKVIIKNNQILEKEFVNFEPALNWHL